MRDLDTGEELLSIENIRPASSKRGYRVLDEEDPVSVSSIKILTELCIRVPIKIESVMLSLSQMFSNVEFSIFGNTAWNDQLHCFLMDEVFFIPKQEVMVAHIDYLEDIIGCNTVIHKHPSGCRNFSSTDKRFINSNFKFSLLWVDRSFKEAIVNLDVVPGIFFQTNLTIEIFRPGYSFEEDITQKIIKKPEPVVSKNIAHSFFRPGFEAGFGLLGRGENLSQKTDREPDLFEMDNKDEGEDVDPRTERILEQLFGDTKIEGSPTRLKDYGMERQNILE